jgi:hypothetical protein
MTDKKETKRGKTWKIAAIVLFAITQLAYDYFSAPVAFPYFKYVTLETASEVTHEWFEEAKEKRNRKDMVQLAKNNMPAMPASELALPSGKSVESLR